MNLYLQAWAALRYDFAGPYFGGQMGFVGLPVRSAPVGSIDLTLANPIVRDGDPAPDALVIVRGLFVMGDGATLISAATILDPLTIRVTTANENPAPNPHTLSDLDFVIHVIRPLVHP